MMIKQSLLTLLLLTSSMVYAQQRVAPPGGGDPHLVMPIAQYVDDEGEGIIDFSHAGYAANEKPLPVAQIRVVVPNVAGDDGERIQAALDYVGRLKPNEQGLRGAVLLKPGHYEVAEQLVIKHSGVVLRGSGADEKGTILTATGRDRRTLIRVLGQNDRTTGESHQIQGLVTSGQNQLTLSDTGNLKPGDRILVTRPSTEAWMIATGLFKIWNAKSAPRWKPGEMDIVWDRTIKSIAASTVTLDAPISMDIDPNWGGGTVATYTWPGRIEQVGIENLQLVSAYDTPRPKDEDHAWMGITMEHARDAWVRGVTFRHFAGSAVTLWESVSRVTVVDCISLQPISEDGGWRRHTFFTSGQQTLFLRCFSEYGRHDFSVGHCAAGPNAFVHCDARMAFNDSGPIGSWATGVLYDNVNIDGNGLRLRYRGRKMQFSAWTAAYCMLWQCTASEMDCYKPPMAQNWAIGCWSDFEGDGYWNAFNDFVSPKSLMQALVKQRVGDKAGEFIGPGIIHPPGATRPSASAAAVMVENSNVPAPQLTEVIAKSIAKHALPIGGLTNVTIDDVLVKHPDLIPPKPKPATQTLTLKNGQLFVGDKLLKGKTMDTYWWRSKPVPQTNAFKEAKREITRFVPGRTGTGWTDDLDEVTSWMVDNDFVAAYQHHGLWYDRRRQDHERVRRMDGEVWAPFDELPFARSGQGTAWDGLSRYDLTRYNPWYFDRLHTFAQHAERKGLVLLNNHYFQHNILEAGAHWADFPWRSANNINNTGFPEPVPYAGDKRIFQAHLFYDVNHPVRRQLHRAYIRHHLEVLSDCPNVIHMTSGEYTGPLHFTQFWLDTIGEWERETGKQVFTALSCTKDVQDAILADPARAAIVDIIDIRFWGPKGGINLAPRQQGSRGSTNSRSGMKEYQDKFPDKAVICSAAGFQIEKE